MHFQRLWHLINVKEWKEFKRVTIKWPNKVGVKFQWEVWQDLNSIFFICGSTSLGLFIFLQLTSLNRILSFVPMWARALFRLLSHHTQTHSGTRRWKRELPYVGSHTTHGDPGEQLPSWEGNTHLSSRSKENVIKHTHTFVSTQTTKYSICSKGCILCQTTNVRAWWKTCLSSNWNTRAGWMLFHSSMLKNVFLCSQHDMNGFWKYKRTEVSLSNENGVQIFN